MSAEHVKIDQSGKQFYEIEGNDCKKSITIVGGLDVSIFILVYNANLDLEITVVWENTTVSCAIIVVSAKGVHGAVNFSVILQASHSKADVYALSLLGDNAKAWVNGGIVIAPWIVQAEGYLSEENLLLGEKIQIKSLPMLDVRSNDVKASHGSKIERLDDHKLFYLRAKWLSAMEAKHLMIQSYIQKWLEHGGIAENNEIIEKIFTYLQ